MASMGTMQRSGAVESWRKFAVVLLFVITIGGLWYPPLGLVAAGMMVVLLSISMFRGRYWCGNLCPRGSFLDLIMRHLSPGRKVPAFLRSLSVRVSILALLMSGLVYSLATLPLESSPEMIGGIYGLIGAIFVRLCLITTIGAVFLALVSQERAWCAVCPMGTMTNLIDRAATKGRQATRGRVATNAEQCRDCGVCERVCPMDIPVRDYLEEGEISDPDCLRCNACVIACPTTALMAGTAGDGGDGG